MPRDDTDADDTPAGEHRSIWLETTPGADYGALDDGVEVDTVIVGGGIVGVSTAFDHRECWLRLQQFLHSY